MKNYAFQILDSIGTFGGIRGHDPSQNGFLQHFQEVLSLNLVPTEFDLGRSFDWISLKLGRAVVRIEYWCCIVFGSVRPNEGGVRGHANSKIFRK